MTDTDRSTVDEAETLSSVMFAFIRVELDWHLAPACTGDPLFVVLSTSVPDRYFPGALGAALPFEGHHAWVFYGRVRNSAADDRVSALLAHVMAHEIAHLLEGSDRHSESGILKAHWSQPECVRMASFPLMFTRADAIVIHRGLDERRSHLASNPVEELPTRSAELAENLEMAVP